ncbi:MAG TPA: class I SAM-dependent methyltransferase [Candidatus Dojkabacteria bacterium]|nr:class I SAM-dependent methyltransferase [Candidatus Dojkabacteria bacterium]
MNNQEIYRERYKKIYPKWKESTTIYHDLILKNVNEKTYLLDVGCGHSTLLADIYSKTTNTYGIDPDINALKRNTLIKNIKNCFVEKMPYKDNFFDLVICSWVLEHLLEPKKSFKEIYRVLKPSGKLIFLTPNRLNYNVWIIRLIPQRFHNFLTQKLYNRQEHDTFPKHYKVNTPKDIEKILIPIGFKKDTLLLNEDPSYISFNTLTFKIALLLEKIFKKRKVHIIGEYRK